MVAAYYPADDDALLDWNECPVGPPPLAVKRVVDAADRLHRYPRGLTEEVTASAAGYFGVANEQLMLTSGVDEATDITLSLGAQAWGLQPGFDGYRDRAAAMAKPYQPIALGHDWQPAPPQGLGLGAEDIVYLAQPNNPTGNFLAAGWLDDVLAAGPYVFVDETYREFSSQRSLLEQLPRRSPKLLVYRSLSKAAGLAGIRLGCVIGDPATIARMYPLRRFMPIDAVSLNAALGLFEEPGFIKQVASYVRDARAALLAVLRASQVFDDVRESEANFVMAKPSAAARELLAGQFALDRVRVKDCGVLGLPGWLRISVGSADDQGRLAESLNRAAIALSGE